MDIKKFVERIVAEAEMRGLFQTDSKAGLIHPIFLENGKAKLNWVGMINDAEGQEKAKKMMNQSDFVAWGKDPWTGQINMKIS